MNYKLYTLHFQYQRGQRKTSKTDIDYMAMRFYLLALLHEETDGLTKRIYKQFSVTLESVKNIYFRFYSKIDLLNY